MLLGYICVSIMIKRSSSIWIVFCIDLCVVFFSIWVAYLLRFNFLIPVAETNTLPIIFCFVLFVRAISFLLFDTHKGIVKFTSGKDAERIFLSIASGSAFFMAFNIITFYVKGIYLIPFSIIIIDGVLAVFLLVSSRMFGKLVLDELGNTRKEKTRVIIFGAGDTGLMAKKAIERDAGAKYKVIAFMDDSPKKIGKKIQGINIKPSSDLLDILRASDVKLLIIAIENLPASRKQQIIEDCLMFNTKIFNVPPVKSWINGELSFKQIKKIKINDLLEREPIQLDMKVIGNALSNKRILVTGAAGSIGSEIVRQIIRFNPGLIILLDIAESPLHDFERELLDEIKFLKIETVLGDIRSTHRMKRLFEAFKPEIVFHAAAYKHVPLVENNPSEALLTNVKGTRVLADLSCEFKVEKFVMISTDKAVNPTNVMGASKRIAEMYVQALNNQHQTQFITTRFGNVLGSNGSVIPLFKKQIERGGPITVTHPEITRFFMTISEACQLVLEAAILGKGGEIFIFDMGKSVKIVDLVRKMIKLSGLTLGKDIEIIYTGLRPGEKLYEELLNDTENTLPTHHPQILIAKVSPNDFNTVNDHVNQLVTSFDNQSNVEIVMLMKALVPEYRSQNSLYELLD